MNYNYESNAIFKGGVVTVKANSYVQCVVQLQKKLAKFTPFTNIYVSYTIIRFCASWSLFV
jgi:hypothetical protein